LQHQKPEESRRILTVWIKQQRSTKVENHVGELNLLEKYGS
jgi:hypothetical protein